jgi:hypothetical protein
VQGKLLPMWLSMIRQILNVAIGGIVKSYVPKV